MRKYLLTLLFLLAVVFCAGCIFPADNQDPIIGTWVSGEYTNLAGTHYLKMVEKFDTDFKIYETLYGSDGTTVSTTSVWIKDGDKKYISYYSPITFSYNPIKNTAVINCDFFNINNIMMSRSDSGNGMSGVWINDEPCEVMEDIYYLQFDIKDDGKGTVTYIKEDKGKNGSSVIYWTELGENMYAITITDPVIWTIENDGKLHDNYGCVYEKETQTQ